MERNELGDIINMLKRLYPKDSFSPGEWYSMYQRYPAEIVRQGIQGWYSGGDWGFRAPTPNDIRGVYVGDRTVGGWDPDGVFQKALDAIEANREIRT